MGNSRKKRQSEQGMRTGLARERRPRGIGYGVGVQQGEAGWTGGGSHSRGEGAGGAVGIWEQPVPLAPLRVPTHHWRFGLCYGDVPRGILAHWDLSVLQLHILLGCRNGFPPDISMGWDGLPGK